MTAPARRKDRHRTAPPEGSHEERPKAVADDCHTRRVYCRPSAAYRRARKGPTGRRRASPPVRKAVGPAVGRRNRAATAKGRSRSRSRSRKDYVNSRTSLAVQIPD